MRHHLSLSFFLSFFLSHSFFYSTEADVSVIISSLFSVSLFLFSLFSFSLSFFVSFSRSFTLSFYLFTCTFSLYRAHPSCIFDFSILYCSQFSFLSFFLSFFLSHNSLVFFVFLPLPFFFFISTFPPPFNSTRQ